MFTGSKILWRHTHAQTFCRGVSITSTSNRSYDLRLKYTTLGSITTIKVLAQSKGGGKSSNWNKNNLLELHQVKSDSGEIFYGKITVNKVS